MSDQKRSLRPVSDHLIVKAVDEDETTASGIILPDTAKEKPQIGEVIAVGPGKMNHGQLVKMEIEVGQKVLYNKYGPTEFKLDGEEYLVLSANDVLAIVV